MSRMLFAAALILLPGVSHAAEAVINGAGSSAAKYVYQSWSEQFARREGVSLAYDAVGSSEGIRRILDGSVQFGASDVAPDVEMLDKNRLVLIPTVVTGAVPVIHFPDPKPRH